MSNNELMDIMNIDYYPEIPENKINIKKSKKIKLNDLANLAPAIAALPNQLKGMKSEVTIPGGNGGEGWYYVTMPKGAKDVLNKFKDGSAYLGSGNSTDGTLFQARLHSKDMTIPTNVPVDPASLAVAVALANINAKLNDINSNVEDIADFLEQDKKSNAKANLLTLKRAFNDYKCNANSIIYVQTYSTMIAEIQRESERDIDFYKAKITKLVNNKSTFNIAASQFEKTMKKIEEYMRCYQFNLYLFSFASFIQVLLLQNTTEEYLNSKINEIRDYSNEYKKFYSDCYNELDRYTKSSIGNQLVKNTGGTIKSLGKATNSIPLLKKTNLDQKLVSVGKEASKLSSSKPKEMMKEFSKLKNAETKVFIDNINIVNDSYNKPLQLAYNGDYIYIK